MQSDLIKMRYFETYYYAQAVVNILGSTFDYLRSLHSWAEDNEHYLFCRPFPKYSRFHSFARFIVHTSIFEGLDEVRDRIESGGTVGKLWLDEALTHHGISHSGFKSYLSERDIQLVDVDEDTLHGYYSDMLFAGPFDELLDHLSDELFALLFANRSAMQKFNEYCCGHVQMLCVDEAPDEFKTYFARDGVLKRTNIPAWARRAVFFRDRGRCSSCRKDISGTVSISNLKNFDHIVPLSQGGINNISNLQLLCVGCNHDKSDRTVSTSNLYEKWY